jgi:tetratricopeptide (TPR) repeat protein/TolB-like protein/predicted Ser/Thr protein kinase
MDLTGRTLGHYRVAEEISRGGMGVVYRATDTRLDRDVALKVLPDALTQDADRRRRFLNEARAASALEHPHIAVIYEADVVDGLAFIAMELIRGEKLADHLARRRPTVARTLELAAEAAAGLARAHEKGIVHRDLKPANVMLSADGHVKIIDFGIAKLIETGATETAPTRTSDATAAGVVVGTTSYMSPEQARGDPVDHRSDIFAFGILLHEMLAGQPPFRGKTGFETANSILSHEAPRLPPLGLDAMPGASAEIQRIVDKCLAKDPSNRYQGMKDVAVDLRAARRRIETAAPAAVATSRPGRVPVWGWVGAAGIAVGLLLWTSGRREATPSATTGRPSVAVLYFDNTTGDPSIEWMRTGIPEMLVTDLSQAGDIEVVGTDRLYGILQELKRQDDRVMAPDVVRAVAERTGVDRVVVGSYVRSGDAIRINVRLQDARSGRIETSERVEGAGTTLFGMIDDLTRRLRSNFAGVPAAEPLFTVPGSRAEPRLEVGLNVLTGSIEAYRLYAEGIFLHERARGREAADLFRQAVAIDPTFAMAYAKLAVAEHNLGHPDLRDRYAQKALSLLEHLTARDRYYIEGFHLGNRLATTGKAIESYQKCAAVDPGDQACRHNLASIYVRLERYQDAADQLEHLVRRGSTFPLVHDFLALSYLAMGQEDRALSTASAFVTRNPDNAMAHATLGRVYVGLNRPEEALTAFAQATLLDRTNVGALVGRSVALVMQENWPGVAALADGLTKSGDDSAVWFGALIHHTASLFRGRGAESAAWGERAGRAYKTATDRTAAGHDAAARAYLALGQSSQAARAAAQALAASRNTAAEPGARLLQTWTLAAAGRRAESDSALAELAAGVDPLAPGRDGRGVSLARGLAALARGDAEAAVPFLQAAQAALPPRGGDVIGQQPHVLVWASLGQALFETGRVRDALPWFERVSGSGFERARQPAQYVRSFYFLGRIHEQQGDTTRARDAYRRFVGYWNDGDLDRDRIAEARRKIAN